MKLDKDTLRQFFLDNAEKMVFGLVALGLLGAVYQLMTRKQYNGTPEKLQGACKDVDDQIKRTPPIPLCEPKDYHKVLQSYVAPKPDTYALAISFQPTIFDPLDKRGTPRVFPVQEVRASWGVGMLHVPPPEEPATKPGTKPGSKPATKPVYTRPGGDTRGRRWVVVTALVPLGQQAKEFRACFAKADRPDSHPADKDRPSYKGWIIERAEVVDSENPADLKWDARFISSAALTKFQKQVTKFDKEIVDRRYVNPKLTFPLPLRAGRHAGAELEKYKASVVHDPQIPVLVEKEVRGDRPTEPVDPAPKPGGFFDDPAKDDPRGRSHVAPGLGVRGPQQDAPKDQEPEYLLLRFFDLGVEAGSVYRYRVSLVLDNPNHDMDSKYLNRPESASSAWLGVGIQDGQLAVAQGLWSAPSNVVAVPDDTHILVKRIHPGDQPVANINVEKLQLNSTKGNLWKVKSFTLRRGMATDFPRPDERFFSLGGALVDMAGGDDMSSNDPLLRRPGELLLMDKDYNLAVYNELDGTDFAIVDTAGDSEPEHGEGPGPKVKPSPDEDPLGGDIFEGEGRRTGPKPRPKPVMKE